MSVKDNIHKLLTEEGPKRFGSIRDALGGNSKTLQSKLYDLRTEGKVQRNPQTQAYAAIEPYVATGDEEDEDAPQEASPLGTRLPETHGD